MIRLQKPRRVYVFPSLRTVKPKPFNHTQPSNPQKSLYLLPVCPFAVLLFCSLTTLTPFLAEGAYKCKTNPERVSRRTPVGVCVATETPPGGVSPVFSLEFPLFRAQTVIFRAKIDNFYTFLMIFCRNFIENP